MSLPPALFPRFPRHLIKDVMFSKYALDFDGVNQLVLVPYHVSLDNFDAFTIGCQIYPTIWADGFNRVIVQKGWGVAGSFIIYLDLAVAGRLHFSTRDSIGTKDATFTLPSLDRWYFITAVFEKTVANKIYVNGIKGIDSPVTANETLTLNNYLSIALDTNDFRGIVDEFFMLPVAFSPYEVMEAFLRGYAKTERDARVVLRMEEGNGFVTRDSSGYGNNGTMVWHPPTWRRMAQNKFLGEVNL